jgi:phospholipase C
VKTASAPLSLAIILIIAGGVASSLVAPYIVLGSGSKIQHLIFIVQENHSFDDYFGTYHGADGFPVNLASDSSRMP